MVSKSSSSRRALNKEDKRQRIRDAAWELFSTLGYEATTTKAVAARAGVASGTLFLYARDKADLLFLVMHERLSAAVDAGFRNLPRPAPLIDQLMHLFSGFFGVYESAPSVARPFIKELPGADGPNAQRVNALTLTLLGQIAGLVQEAQANGDIEPNANPMLLGHVSFSLYFSALLSWAAGFSSLVGSRELLRSSLELVIRGAGTRSEKSKRNAKRA